MRYLPDHVMILHQANCGHVSGHMILAGIYLSGHVTLDPVMMQNVAPPHDSAWNDLIGPLES